MRAIYLLCFLLISSVPAVAQNTQPTDNSAHVKDKDRATQEFLNNAGTEAALINGGAFYVSNPPPLYKLDVEKAYLDKEFRKMHVVFRNGDAADINGRIRTIDQKIELMREGGVYELRDNYVEYLTTHDSLTYLFLLDPMKRSKGWGIYERAFAGEDYQLLVYNTAEWKDPPKQNMFDTSDAERTLDPKQKVYLQWKDGKTYEIKNIRGLVLALGTDNVKRSDGIRRRFKLRNNVADYVQLLTALRE